MSQPEIETFASPDALAAAVAGRLVVALAAAQGAERTPHVGLTGGSIAEKIHAAVVTASGTSASAREQADDQPDEDGESGEDAEPGARTAPAARLHDATTPVDWSRVAFWWGDERYVPAADPERNAKQAWDAMLSHLDVNPRNVHEAPASDGDHADVHEAAEAYADEVREHCSEGFEILMLGVGPDGHVASLFPGSEQLDATGAIAVGVTDSPKPPSERVTLTFEALARSREVWFVVSGEAKADAVAQALATGDDAADVHAVPAAGVHGTEVTRWFLDEPAASMLPEGR